MNAIGPVPADTVFYKTKQGMYDLTIALYHDQGLGAVKLLGFGDRRDPAGRPAVHPYVDRPRHRLRHRRHRQGGPQNLLEAIRVAAELGDRGGPQARGETQREGAA